MAIPENFIDKITKDGESRMISPAADMVRVNNEEYESKNLDDVLSEIADAIGDAASSADLSGLFAGVSYDSGRKEISFLDKGNNVVATLDAKPFVRDGMVSGVTLTNGVLTITFNTDAGKQPIEISLGDLFNADNYYTKTDADGKFVVQVSGKGLSTNDYTNADMAAVATIADKADKTTVPDAYQPRLTQGTGIAINGSTISVETGSVAEDVDLPVSGNDVFQALDGITAGQTVVINSDGANIIDDYSDSVLIATSARLVKELYLNLQQLRNNLANMAFTNGKPSWITVAKRQYDLSLASSGNDGLSKVYIVNGENETELTTTATQVNEGAVKLRFKPTQSSYAFTSIVVNGNDVLPSAVNAGKNDGSVYVVVTISGDTTVSATAANGVTVSMGSSTNCSMNIASQAVDENFSRQITASNHYTLPSAITVKLNGSTMLASGTDYTYTRANDNKTATLEIDKSKFANATSIEVTCAADPVDSCTVFWNQVDMIVKHGNDVLFDNGTLATPSHTVYADDLNYALTFEAATGKKFTTAPNVGGTTLSSNNGVYMLTVNNVTNDVTVGAAVDDLESFGVSLLDTASSEDPNETPYTEGNLKLFSDAAKTIRLTVTDIDINEGDSFTCYLGSDESNTGISKEIVWDILNGIDYPVKVEMESSGTMVDITSTSFIQKGLLLMVSVPNVTGNIVITGRTMEFKMGYAYTKNSSTPVTSSNYCVTNFIPINGATKLVTYGEAAAATAASALFSDKTSDTYGVNRDHPRGSRLLDLSGLSGYSYYRESLLITRRKHMALLAYNPTDGYYPLYIGILGDRRYINAVASGGYDVAFGTSALNDNAENNQYGAITAKLDVSSYTKLTYVTAGLSNTLDGYANKTHIKQFVGNTQTSNLSWAKTRVADVPLGSGVTSIQAVMLYLNTCFVFGCDNNNKWHLVYKGLAYHMFAVNSEHVHAKGTGDAFVNPTYLSNNGAERTYYIHADEGYEFATPTEVAPTITMNGVDITDDSVGGSVTWDSENNRYIMYVPFLSGDIIVTADNVQAVETPSEE